MATNKRSYPNSYFAWYNDDDRLAIVCKVLSNDATETVIDKYDTYSGDSVAGGLRIHTHSKYGTVDSIDNDLKSNSGLDTSLHGSIADYIKSRLLEDNGDMQNAMYYRNKYEKVIKQYPHRKSGVRALSVPRM